MDAERWQRLNFLFEEASGLPQAEIEPYLRTACSDDAELYREALKLVNAHLGSGDFIRKPPITQVAKLLSGEEAEADMTGRRIGSYQIEKELGRGGMGAVYLAHRVDAEYRKTVAIKLVKRGISSDDVMRRFRHERQVLADLDHPNIARLLDGGTASEGTPYFVLEYISGGRIDTYCDERRLSLRDRLELFRQVCSAVDHAHKRRIIHRDLKPANILVTDDGVPKLLDFGIAKMLQESRSLESMQTAAGIRLLTPDYASPEQFRGESLTTSTDIFSLGVILSELIYPPNTGKGHWQDAPPSEESTAEKAPIVDKALLAILQKAKHAEACSRYASAAQLSEDIRRYLLGLDLIADLGGVKTHRHGSFVNRSLVLAGIVIVAAITAGILATPRGLNSVANGPALSHSDANDVRRLAQTAPTDHSEAIKAIQLLDEMVKASSDDDSLKPEIAAAYEQIGDVQNELTARESRNKTAAVESYKKSVALRELIITDSRPTDEIRRGLALTCLKLARLEHEIDNRNGGALDHGRRSLTILIELVMESPSEDELRFQVMEAYYQVGQILVDSGANEAAEAHYRRFGAIIESLTDATQN